jgi:hypothetical protein
MDLSELELHFSEEIEVSNIIDGINDPRKYDLVRGWCDRYYNEPKEYELKLEAINVIVGESGVESLVEDGKHLASYVNNGDTYKPTILYDIEEGEFLVTSWGEFLKEWQKESLIEIDCEDVAQDIYNISHSSDISWDDCAEGSPDEYDCLQDYYESAYVDVRLQVTEDNGYHVRWGDSQFDTDHRGAWGSSSVGMKQSMEDCKAIAKDLISQAAEDADTCLTKTIKAYNDDN